ncbi:MAG: nucleotidyltransferase domain-containing protein [Chloroflexota bacterium]
MATAELLLSTVPQRVLALLAKAPDREFYGRQIAGILKTSPTAASEALKSLHEAGMLRRRMAGRTSLYSLDAGNPVAAGFKKLVPALLLEPLIQRLKSTSNRVILYGSSARGEDTSSSDLDLFVVAGNRQRVMKLVQEYRFPPGFESLHIQAVVRTPAELLTSSGDEDDAFLNEVEQGIVLWDKGAS